MEHTEENVIPISFTCPIGYGIVYKLICPLTGEIKYYGQTRQRKPYRRFHQHLREARKGSNLELYRWIRELGVNGYKPIFAYCGDGLMPVHKLDSLEKYLISYSNNLLTGEVFLYNNKAGGQGYCYNPESQKVKLNWKLVQALRDEHNAGKRISKIAKDYNLARETVRDVINRITWNEERKRNETKI